MAKILIGIFAVWLGISGSGGAFAAEITTDCPPAKPGQPEMLLKYGEPHPGGIPLAGPASEHVEKDGLLYTKDVYGTEPIYNSILMCEYQDGSEIKVTVPGGLLYCGTTIREISRTPPIRNEFLRVWCVSEVK